MLACGMADGEVGEHERKEIYGSNDDVGCNINIMFMLMMQNMMCV